MKRPSRDYKIGDTEPMPADADMDRARLVMRMRGHLERQAASKSRTERKHRAINILAGLEEAERRANDPVEQAKTFLRGLGYRPVAKLNTHDWQVGRLHFATERQMLAFALKRGWKK